MRIVPPRRESLRYGSRVTLECRVERGSGVRTEWRRAYSRGAIAGARLSDDGRVLTIDTFDESHQGARFSLSLSLLSTVPVHVTWQTCSHNDSKRFTALIRLVQV